MSYLGFASGAAGVEDKQRVLSIQPLGFTLFRRISHCLVPPHVTLWVPGGLNTPQQHIKTPHYICSDKAQAATPSILNWLQFTQLLWGLSVIFFCCFSSKGTITWSSGGCGPAESGLAYKSGSHSFAFTRTLWSAGFPLIVILLFSFCLFSF